MHGLSHMLPTCMCTFIALILPMDIYHLAINAVSCIGCHIVAFAVAIPILPESRKVIAVAILPRLYSLTENYVNTSNYFIFLS